MALTQVSRGLLSTSIVDNGNSTAITIDSSENVGIGSSPAYKLDVSGSVRLKTGATGTPVIVSTGSDSQGTLRFGSSGNEYSINSGADYLAMVFNTNGTGRMRIDSSGNVGIGASSIDYQASNRTVVHIEGSAGALLALEDTGAKSYLFQTGNDLTIENDTSTGSMIFGTNASTERMRILSTGGITFNGDTAQANALDDYEEGTFSGTIDGNDYSGEYVKVGKLVTVSCYYDTTSATGNRIAVVPFSATGAVSSANQGQTITRSTSGTHPTGTYAGVFSTTNNVYAYNYGGATLTTPSSGNGNFQFSYYTNS